MYVKINLLPHELRPRKALIAVDVRVLFVLAVISAAIFFAWQYLSLVNTIDDQQAELRNWQQQETMLQDTVALQNEVNELRDEVSKRISVISDLTGDSDLRFAMLQYMTEITPENLWLLRITERTDTNTITFTIEGMSYTKEDISLFLARLQDYKYFESVALESIRPAPLEIRDAYQYSVLVELKNDQASDEVALTDAGNTATQ